MLARTALAVVLLAASGMIAAGGCSTSAADPNTCRELSDCPTWRCTCRDGKVASTADCQAGLCVAGHDLCTTVCYDFGGLQSTEEVPDLTKSAECDALCAKVDALGCGATCDRSYWCKVGATECAEQKRALLACEVDGGAWQCNPSGGVTVTSACRGSSCSADAGLDAPSDAPASDAPVD